MTIAGIRSGDIVRCDVRGDLFYALVDVLHNEPGRHLVMPIGRSNGARGGVRLVSTRQIIGHWRKRKARAT